VTITDIRAKRVLTQPSRGERRYGAIAGSLVVLAAFVLLIRSGTKAMDVAWICICAAIILVMCGLYANRCHKRQSAGQPSEQTRQAA